MGFKSLKTNKAQCSMNCQHCATFLAKLQSTALELILKLGFLEEVCFSASSAVDRVYLTEILADE